MTSPDPRPPDAPTSRPRLGLRLRLWLGCLGGTLLALAGLVWALLLDPAGAAPTPEARLTRIVIGLLPALVAGVLFALWLDRGIVGRLRGLTRALALGPPPSRPGKRLERGWGELGDLTDAVQAGLARQRQLGRAADELQRLELQIRATEEAIARWATTERWQPLPVEDGLLRGATERLNQGFARESEVLEQNQRAALQMKADLTAALESARESAEQAEHGFVEATALLTTVRELQRLSGELQQIAPVAAPAVGGEALEQWRVVAAGAIEELIGAANESVEHLGSALLRVRGIAEQVHLLANRATLIALNSLISGAPSERGSGTPEGAATEMKQLAREVRVATDRVGELSAEIEHEVQSASERMRGIRERVAMRLEQAPIAPAAEPSRAADDAARLLDRVREMVQDATRKCERLSIAGERTSRAADTLVQRLEDEARDIEGLAVRLAPTGGPRAAETPAEAPGRGTNLRLLAPENAPGAAPGRRREERP